MVAGDRYMVCDGMAKHFTQQATRRVHVYKVNFSYLFPVFLFPLLLFPSPNETRMIECAPATHNCVQYTVVTSYLDE